ncbi:hypothetical protein BDK61_4201 [Haloarcula quadrata]|nr:hypothetical protein BDK61_4201 [Haloarcula quadrata]
MSVLGNTGNTVVLNLVTDNSETVEYADVDDISPMAWRLLRVAAGYEQRGVEREVDDLMQAHLSMLENGTRGLSDARRQVLFDLYAVDLSPDQINAIVTNF